MNKPPYRSIAGWALALAIALAALHGLYPELPKLLVALPIWLAGLLTWSNANSRTRKQALLLSAIGCLGLVIAWQQQQSINLELAFAGNSLLIAMLAAVSFLRLVSQPQADQSNSPPKGRDAAWTTYLGTHLFGAVINLSIVFIIAERLRHNGPIQRRHWILLTRGFSAAAFWSPFFAAMAASLSYTPGARLDSLMLGGLPLAILSLLLTVGLRGKDFDTDFNGYPMHYSTLWLPATLAVTILLLHQLNPGWLVLSIICLLAPLIALIYRLFSKPENKPNIKNHISQDLPGMSNELLLFLSAGLMASGVDASLSMLDGWPPFDQFAGPEACMTLLMMFCISLLGVHPVIGISVFGTALAPLADDPSLLAMTFLFAWGISVNTSPFSGMNLALQGRFGVSAFNIMRWNLPHSLIMLTGACGILMAYAKLFTSQ